MKKEKTETIFSSMEHFSSVPPPELWDRIEEKLDKPKKKKRAIFWWSIAASVLVGLSIPAVLYFNSDQGFETPNPNGTLFQQNGVVIHDKRIDPIKNEVSSTAKKSTNETQINKHNLVNTAKIAISEESDKFSDKENDEAIKNSKSGIKTGNNNVSSGVVTVSFSSSKAKNRNGLKQSNQQIPNLQEAIIKDKNVADVIATKQKSSPFTPETISTKQNETSNRSAVDKSKSVAVSKNSNTIGLNKDGAIASNTISKDSLNKIKLEVEKLENVLVKLEEEKTKKKKNTAIVDKWSVQVFAGVSSSENYKNEKALGSSVDSKQSNAYGVKTNYKLNKKWAVSSGFKINELGQEIAGVSYYDKQSSSKMIIGSLPSASETIQTDLPTNNSAIVSISSNQNYLFLANAEMGVQMNSGFEKGDVAQRLKYVEMPLEVSYSILSEKKATIKMNTGGFVGKLVSNEIFLNGNSIGENKNVNDFVYGTVLSSTLQYELFKKTNFFVEPGMNYYINPLKDQPFNQFQWMFNFGLNISF